MKTIVTGSNGLLGSALQKKLGVNNIYHTRKDANLLYSEETHNYFNNLFFNKKETPNTIIHCAARVGGIQANMNNNQDFFFDNIKIDNNILENSFRYSVENFVSILSTCIFPDDATYPLTSNQIDAGPPHSSNYGYSYAKRLLGYQTKIFRNVIKKNWISIIPTNVYGPNDYFNLDKCHLIPALIRKAYEAKQNGTDFVIWGSGKPLRQFIYSEDLAKIILWAIDNWNSDISMMAINEREYSIKEIANIIAKKFEIPYERIVFDKTKPDGQMRKPGKTDVPKNFNFLSLEDGLDRTINWFVKNYKNLRK